GRCRRPGSSPRPRPPAWRRPPPAPRGSGAPDRPEAARCRPRRRPRRGSRWCESRRGAGPPGESPRTPRWEGTPRKPAPAAPSRRRRARAGSGNAANRTRARISFREARIIARRPRGPVGGRPLPVRPKDAVEWRSAWVGPDVARNRESIMKGFARQARAFARSPLQRDPERLGRLLAFAAPRPDEAALDVACGPGIVTAALARRAGLAVGVDLAREMIDEARGAGGLYLRADVERLPFKDGSFDLVICRNACHHFADPPVVAREMRR